MIPRDLASGPLILSMPASLRWPTNYLAKAPYHQLSFSTSGSVTFQVIAVR